MAMTMAAQGVAGTAGLGFSFERRNFAGPKSSTIVGESKTTVCGDGFFGGTQLLVARSRGCGIRVRGISSSKKAERVGGVVVVRAARDSSSSSFDHIPKHFRGDHLTEGLSENFKNVPRHLYGLNPAQMDMFMNEDSPMKRQAERVTEDSISSAQNYKEGTSEKSSSLSLVSRATHFSRSFV
jgi:hypothetical protein